MTVFFDFIKKEENPPLFFAQTLLLPLLTLMCYTIMLL